jgi:hypothetical protein
MRCAEARVEGNERKITNARRILMENLQTIRARIVKLLDGIPTDTEIHVALRYGGPSEILGKLAVIRDELTSVVDALKETEK